MSRIPVVAVVDTCCCRCCCCSLERRLSDVQKLWTLKQRQLKKNMIFATISVVKNWDVNQVRNWDVNQVRNWDVNQVKS